MVSLAYQASTIDIGFLIERLIEVCIIIVDKKKPVYTIKNNALYIPGHYTLLFKNWVKY